MIGQSELDCRGEASIYNAWPGGAIMNHMKCLSGLLMFVLAPFVAAQPAATQPAVERDMNTGATYEIKPGVSNPPPKEWVDKDTGHRVVRLTDEPGSQSLYFNIPAYSPDGKKMTFFSPT